MEACNNRLNRVGQADYTDSHGVSVKGKYGPTRYWIRTTSEGSAVMKTEIRYDAFDYRANGLYKVTGSMMPSMKRESLESCEKRLAKLLKDKEVIA